MSINKKEYEIENQYLNNVLSILDDEISNLSKSISVDKKENIDFKKFIWQECQSMSELELGTVRSNAEYKVSQTNKKIDELSKYQRMYSSPYFGRIDFENENDTTQVYIGLSNLNKNDYTYIYDWRAPISSLFYDYSIGKAQYTAPIGKIKGNILLRRQYKIENSKLERVIENDINISDEVLQEVLANNSNDKMKSIVTTIQKEQNTVIRDSKDKYLVVQGVAGSGKTSVALHRIAYLLYKDEYLNSNNVLIFSPNEIFSDYISNVLPDLGENNVLNTTFNDLIKRYLKKVRKTEDFSIFLERIYNSNNRIINYDKHKIDSFLKRYFKNTIFKSGLKVGTTYYNEFELNNLLLSRYGKLPIIERINRISEYLCRNSRVKTSNYKKKVVSLLIDDLGLETNVFNIYQSFLLDVGINRNIDRVLYEDLPFLVYIYFELNGYPYDVSIKHIVIDEAQDYSLLQFYLLKKIFPYAYFTILGDVNQAINPYCNYQSLNELSVIFDNLRYVELTKTYRSSEEIISYSNEILGLKIKSVRGNNGINVLTKDKVNINTLKEDISLLKRNNMKSIAIITKNDKEARKLYLKLNENEEFVLNKMDSNKISIISAYIAKGLEFDAVISYNCTNDSNEEYKKKLYYVVCTRAQHQLIVYNS